VIGYYGPEGCTIGGRLSEEKSEAVQGIRQIHHIVIPLVVWDCVDNRRIKSIHGCEVVGVDYATTIRISVTGETQTSSLETDPVLGTACRAIRQQCRFSLKTAGRLEVVTADRKCQSGTSRIVQLKIARG